LLESFLLDFEGVRTLEVAGLKVVMEETGTCLAAPDAFVFMQGHL
jgi:hypothetical protein